MSLHDGRAVVQVAAVPVCQRCASGQGCGAGLLVPAEGTQTVEATISDFLQPAVGDCVDIELAATNVLRAALLTYGLPLALMLGFVAVGWMISGTLADSVATALAAIGLLLGCTISARRLRQGACLQQFVPRIVGIDHSPADSKKSPKKS